MSDPPRTQAEGVTLDLSKEQNGEVEICPKPTLDKSNDDSPSTNIPTDSNGGETIHETEDNTPIPRDVSGRLESIEAKFDVLQTLIGPDEEEESDISDGDSDDDPLFRLRQRNFRDTLWFIARSKKLYIQSKARRKQKKAALAAASEEASSAPKERIDSLEEISATATLKGNPAVIQWVAWKYFITHKGNPETSVLAPIDVVIGEPEPHIILQFKPQILDPSTAQVPRKRPCDVRPAERAKASEESFGQLSLPERIKIHSTPLFELLRRVMTARSAWKYANDGSTVFVRPYREFVYYEQGLREALANLENHVEQIIESEKKIASEKEEQIKNGDSKDTVEKTVEVIPDGNPDSESKEVEVQQEVDEEDAGSVKAEDDDVPNPMTTLLHLRCLIQFIDEELKPKMRYIDSDKCRKILFNDLWHLFKPGNEVIDQKEKQAYRIVRVECPRHKVEDPYFRWNKRPSRNREEEEDSEADTLVKVHCAYIDFDGKQFGPVSKKFVVAPFGGLRDVKSLPIYPLRFAKDPKLREKLISQGKMLLAVSKYKSMYYSGYTLNSRDEVDSQVVVDFSEALSGKDREDWIPSIDSLRTAPDSVEYDKCMAACCYSQAVAEDDYIDSRLTEDFVKSLIPDTSFAAPSLLLSPRPLEETRIGSEDEPTEEEYVVMTYRVFGFVLRSRKWAQLDLNFLKTEDTDASSSKLSAFEQLELPEGHRDMVRSLVTQHFRERHTTSARDEQTDLIKGKGKGLILLLHGAPGVGKTTTAEGVAELFKKPLFQITCGDLGNTAREVEAELEKNFALASRWGCILLLDEADVFLSARERKDFERNGLVAVFLRILEYYAGILFLTTNRIGDFDEAFASRIHMSLYYPELDKAKTQKIFKLNLKLIQDRFDRDGRKLERDLSAIERFAGDHFDDQEYNRWNGRQIRNLCQTALSLAEFDAHGGRIDGEVNKDVVVRLQLRYFEAVQKAYIEFGEYLGDIRGTLGDQRAYDHALRSKKGTAYQTTPSKFSRVSRSSARHSNSASQAELQMNQFQPLVNQSQMSGLGQNLTPAYSQPFQSNLYGSQQSYPYQGNLQVQMDPRFNQNLQMQQGQQFQPAGFNPQGQGWPASNMPMNYNQQVQQTEGQNVQGGGFQTSQYSQFNQQGGVPSNTTGGADPFTQGLPSIRPTGTPVEGVDMGRR